MKALDTNISYEVVRSRRSTADIVIERDGSILVRAPQNVPDQRIEDIVDAKRYWIYKNLAEWRDLNATRILREYRNGEGFLYLGRSYRLSLVAEQEDALQLRGGSFQLRRDLVEKNQSAMVKKAFRDFYVSRGNERIRERVKYFAPKVGISPKRVGVRDLGNRWAALSGRRNLSFHWKCMMAPQTIIDYIVVHELCHFLEFNHTEAFWNEVDKVIPAYRERKEWLRRNGAGLDI